MNVAYYQTIATASPVIALAGMVEIRAMWKLHQGHPVPENKAQAITLILMSIMWRLHAFSIFLLLIMTGSAIYTLQADKPPAYLQPMLNIFLPLSIGLLAVPALTIILSGEPRLWPKEVQPAGDNESADEAPEETNA